MRGGFRGAGRCGRMSCRDYEDYRELGSTEKRAQMPLNQNA